VNAFFNEQGLSDFLPRLAPLAQFADEIKVRFQDAVVRPAAAFRLIHFSHQLAA
jgi:hypothetical protein